MRFAMHRWPRRGLRYARLLAMQAIFDLFLEAYGFTCADSHFQVTRPAKRAACDGYSEAKQSKQGNGKEGFTNHASPLSMIAFTISRCLVSWSTDAGSP